MGSGRRAEIARVIVDAARERLVMQPDRTPIGEAVSRPAPPFPTEIQRFGPSSGLRPRVVLDGVEQQGSALADAVFAMVDRGSASPPVGEAIAWIVDRAGRDGIDLSGRRIAILGAAAELAPTRLWLEGGADVLWIDVADPPPELLDRGDLGGTLRWVPGGADLLTDADRVRATIEEFAGGEPVDVGLYAYAGGSAREWRLTAAMNAIVDALPEGVVQGVALLVSPTTCGVLSDADLAGEAERRANAPWWQRGLERVGALGRGGGHTLVGETATNRGVVSIQGGSYQGAQYVGKLLAAEVWATADATINVSANTAGVSLTESMQHPVFQTAFAGASALGVETFAPSTTVALNGLLTLHDRLDPEAADRALDDLFATRVHGGLYVTPYPIDPALRVAAALGVMKRPRRIGALIGR